MRRYQVRLEAWVALPSSFSPVERHEVMIEVDAESAQQAARLVGEKLAIRKAEAEMDLMLPQQGAPKEAPPRFEPGSCPPYCLCPGGNWCPVHDA